MQTDSEDMPKFALGQQVAPRRIRDWIKPSRRARLHNARRLEKQLKDFAGGGLALVWQRQGIYLGAALLSGYYYNLWLSLICYAICQSTELLDTIISWRVMRWKDGKLKQAHRYLQLLLLSSTLSAMSVGLFAVLVARFEGPSEHFASLFFLFAAGLFAAVNNHQLPQVLLVRLAIYTAVFLYIPLVDIWTLRPPLQSKLWLQFATVVFVLFFVLECSMIFLRLYRKGLDQLEELRLERDRAREAYEIKSQFVSVVSHELRTPLTSIIGSISLLQQANMISADPDKAEKILKIGQKNSERLLVLINDLLDLQKLESGQMSYTLGKLDLHHVVEDAIEALGPYAQEYGVDLAILPSPDPIELNSDFDRLHQVLNNLLSNAIKFSPRGQKVEVSIHKAEKTVLLKVRDYGVGIPPGSRDLVFGQFRQVDGSDQRSHDGTGLGLSITQQIVSALGGNIDYESTLGAGTTFTVELPLD